MNIEPKMDTRACFYCSFLEHTLEHTLTAKRIEAFCHEHPKGDKSLIYTPSERTGICDHFHMDVPFLKAFTNTLVHVMQLK